MLTKIEPPRAVFISTPDITTLTNISRWQLDGYVKKGIVEPFRASDAPQSDMHRTADQLHLILNVPQLQRTGMSSSDIVDLADQGMPALENALLAQSTSELRESFRDVMTARFRIDKAPIDG